MEEKMEYIDINSDVGESFGYYVMGEDEKVFRLITSANIACGLHGGDPLVMRRSVEMAKSLEINIGAHPGLPDLAGFGRRKMDITPEELKSYIIYQIGALKGFCSAVKAKLSHVKIHGILPVMAAENKTLGKAIIEGIMEIDEDLMLYCRVGTSLSAVAKELGLQQIDDFPVDRAINKDNSLVKRRLPGAVIENVEEVVKRTVRLICEGKIDTCDNNTLEFRPKTICVHGDNPNAVNLLSAIKSGLKKEGITVRALSL
jgi:UPF0271 protein